MERLKVAIDAMGGDHAPAAMVEGALLALEQYQDIEIVLVGKEQLIEEELQKHQAYQSFKNRLGIQHTEDVIETDEEPVKAVRRKKDSSLVKVAQLVKDGEVAACISAGNTGAYMTAGLLVTGRMKGVERPGLATYFPTVTGEQVLVLDVGANVDAKAQHLQQYALMGKVYAEKVMGISNPRIGLLNVGAEDSKGNELTKEAFKLISESDCHFVGNVEARDVMFNQADVIVCDGFSGNVLLKTAEGTAGAIFTLLKEAFTSSTKNKLAALMVKPSLKGIKAKLDYAEYGGAPLLGLKGVCIKAHGSSGAIAMKNAVGQAYRFIKGNVLAEISDLVQKESDA